jgi:hypothetical protein
MAHIADGGIGFLVIAIGDLAVYFGADGDNYVSVYVAHRLRDGRAEAIAGSGSFR